MSDDAPQQQTPQTELSQQQSIAQPSLGVDASGRIVAAPGVPAHYVGRTLPEVFEIAETYKDLASRPSQPAPQQAPLSYQQPMGLQPPDPQLMYSDPALYQQQMLAYNQFQNQQYLQQAAQPMVQNMAYQARAMAEQRDADAFRRWGHEIDRELSALPLEQRNAQAYAMAIDMVRGRHWKELAAEEARTIAASGGGLERSGPGGFAGGVTQAVDPLDDLFSKEDHPWVKKAKETGLTKSEVIAYCGKTGRNVNDYVKSILDGNVLTAKAS